MPFGLLHGYKAKPGVHPQAVPPHELDMDDEEEVDQLDSDLDEDEGTSTQSGGASSSKTRPRRTGERVPGRSLIPTTRVENMMYADGIGGHMSKEALFMLSIATEEFVKRLAQAGQRAASHERRSTVNYRDVAFATQQHHEFAFLSDMIPPPTTLSQALEQRALREKQMAEEDPAIAPSVHPEPAQPSSAPQFISHPPPKPKTSKSRQTNGDEKINGSVSAGPPTKRKRDPKGRWSVGASTTDSPAGSGGEGTSTNGSTRQSSARVRSRSSRSSRAQRSASANGHAAASSGTSTPTPSMSMQPPPLPAPPRPSHGSTHLNGHLSSTNGRPDEPWSLHSSHPFTGPASGLMDDRRMLFNGGGRGSGMTDAPGRTIYSQQRPSLSDR